jgi:hypothetical protein
MFSFINLLEFIMNNQITKTNTKPLVTSTWNWKDETRLCEKSHRFKLPQYNPNAPELNMYVESLYEYFYARTVAQLKAEGLIK